MKPLTYLLSLILVFLVSPVQGEGTVTLHGRLTASENETPNVWIGVFELPMEPTAEAWSWTQVESTEFTVNVPNVEEIQLVTLRKDFLPLVQRIRSESADEQFVLNFQQGLTLEGTLLSTDGIPVADARLTVERNDLLNVLIPDHTRFLWSSDAEGRFRIAGLSANERFEIHTELPFVQDDKFEVRMPENGEYLRDFSLSDAYFVMGRVVNSDRDPVPNATVRFRFTLPEEWRATTTSNAEGEFQFGPFARNTEIWLSAHHIEQGTSKNLRATAGEHGVELVLASMVHVIGTTIDASTGELIDDFTLVAVGADESREYRYVESKGEVSSLVPRETTALVVHSDVYIAHFITELELTSIDEFDIGVIALQRGRELTGQVYDATTNEPVVQATVSLVPEYSWDENTDPVWGNLISGFIRESVQSITDKEGGYTLSPLPSQAVHIRVFGWEYGPEEFLVDEITTVFDIPMVSWKSIKTRIRGRVENAAGEPVGGSVKFLYDGGYSGLHVQDDGHFDHPLDPGTYEAIAITEQGNSDLVQVDVNEDEIKEITLIVESKGRVLIKVAGLWDGETVSLSVFSESLGSDVRNIYQVVNGEFDIYGIGFGEFTLNASSSWEREQELPFELSEESSEASIELNFAGNSRLYGSLRFPDGTFPIGQVEAIPKQSGKTSNSCEITDDGMYEINGLDDGEYTLHTWETKEVTVMYDDGTSSSTATSTPVDQVDVVVQGNTEYNIQLPSQFDNE